MTEVVDRNETADAAASASQIDPHVIVLFGATGDLAARKLRTAARRMPGYFSEDPVTTFRRHIWINPFWEDDVDEIVGLMGDDRVIFGSDWPHVEGLPDPTDWVAELQKLPPESVAKVMGTNTAELNVRRPA